MSLTKRKQIDAPHPVARRPMNAATILTGTGTYNVTASMLGATGGGSDSEIGVITTAPKNKAVLVRRDNGRAVERAGGDRIYGRLTFAANVFTLTLYVSDGAGGETAYVPVAGDALNNVAIDMIYIEIVKFENVNPTDAVNLLDSLDDVAVDPNSHQSDYDVFTNQAANTVAFVLTNAPKVKSVTMSINGQLQTPVLDFTVAGATVTYTARHFPIAVSDEIVITYDR